MKIQQHQRSRSCLPFLFFLLTSRKKQKLKHIEHARSHEAVHRARDKGQKASKIQLPQRRREKERKTRTDRETERREREPG